MENDDELIRALGWDKYISEFRANNLIEETNAYVQTFDKNLLGEQLFNADIGVTPLNKDMIHISVLGRFIPIIKTKLFAYVKEKVPGTAKEITRVILDNLTMGGLAQTLIGPIDWSVHIFAIVNSIFLFIIYIYILFHFL